MKNKIATYFQKLTFQRQLSITVTLGILFLALFSSIVGSWRGNERVRHDLIEQGQHITENLAQQSALALVYSSADNAAEAVRVTMAFPGVVGVEIHNANQHILLKQGNINLAEFTPQVKPAGRTGIIKETQAAAVLDAESQNAWRFSAPVYSQPSSSPFNEVAAPELLGYVTVIVSKAALTRMTSDLFIANLTTSLSFALLILFLIRLLSYGITRPLNQLSACMERAEAGESEVRAVLAGPKDIADMAHAFNSMMAVQEERAQKIQQLNADLEQRVNERTAQLESANKELESFSYSVSHDLRTPLRAIDGYSHILLDDYSDKLDNEGKRLLNVVRDNTGRMGQLIDDMLKFSRTGRIELSFAEIDMEKLAHTIFEEIQPSFDSSKLQLEIGHLPPAKGDSNMMRQVFVNLLSNAIKFSSHREVAKIQVGGSIEGDEAVYFVKDNGAGFDMKYADKLFGVFQRLHSTNEFEGTGIGLAIVKRVVTRHGGRVWAEGKVDEGATIYFALPTKEIGSE